MDKTEVLRKVTEFSIKARDYLTFSKVVLFGSYVVGKPREDSDFDVAFFVDEPDDSMDYLTLLINLNKLAGKIDSRIETHIFYKDDETSFADYIIKNGQEISFVN